MYFAKKRAWKAEKYRQFHKKTQNIIQLYETNEILKPYFKKGYKLQNRILAKIWKCHSLRIHPDELNLC